MNATLALCSEPGAGSERHASMLHMRRTPRVPTDSRPLTRPPPGGTASGLAILGRSPVRSASGGAVVGAAPHHSSIRQQQHTQQALCYQKSLALTARAVRALWHMMRARRTQLPYHAAYRTAYHTYRHVSEASADFIASEVVVGEARVVLDGAFLTEGHQLAKVFVQVMHEYTAFALKAEAGEASTDTDEAVEALKKRRDEWSTVAKEKSSSMARFGHAQDCMALHDRIRRSQDSPLAT